MTVTLDTDQERINLPCVQTYRWKEKLAVLMLPRIQLSLQRTKTLRGIREFIGALHEGEYAVTR